MQSYLEQLLTEKNKEEENYLYTQWSLTKNYIPKVQAVISHIFPHFSLHDDTHSETILSRVESLLGREELKKLSITDVWLMLSAAYYHDVGMVMMANDIEEIFAEENFQEHVKWIQGEQEHPLHPFAELYEVKNDGIYYKTEKLCGKTFDAARYLLADYVRKCHHKRSRTAIDADDLLHLKGSPIPARLVDYLGRICECHNMDYKDVMKLPKTEMGVYGDTCHPRFIAYMLRLGDLLDLDNNRFSDVLLGTLTQIPEDSLNHKKKHLAIQHFFLDSKHLELNAVCHDYDVYEITDQWFGMIKDEISWQKGNWANIVPESITVSLPVIDQLDIRLLDYDIIDGKKKPEFTIETPKAIELLQGAGIYKHKASSIKELLQNAVDASNISLYLECTVNGTTIANPDELYSISNKRPIIVKLVKEKVVNGFVNWRIVVEDKGVGISKEDMKYLLQTGSRNEEKQKIVNNMPEFMRPSGSFGIGFQSVYLLTDEVTIESWKQNTNSHIVATLYNPTGPKKGRVVMKSDDSNAGRHGTVVSFVYRVPNVPARITYTEAEPLPTRVAEEYDFVKDETLDYEIAKIVEEVQHFGKMSHCPVKLSIDDSDSIEYRQPEGLFDYYSEKYGLQLNIYEGAEYMSRDFFKSQLVGMQSRSRVDFLAADANILTGDAKEILTLNRSNIRRDYAERLTDRIIAGITEMVCQKVWKKEDKQMRALAAMFLQQYHTKEELSSMKVDWLDKWQEYTLADKKTSLSTIIRQGKNATVRYIIDDNAKEMTYVGRQRKMVCIKDGLLSKDSSILCFMLNYLMTSHPYVVYTTFTEEGAEKKCFELSKTKRPLIENWKGLFQSCKLRMLSTRMLIPCNDKYAALRVDRDEYWSVMWTFPWKLDVPLMICPYAVRRERTASTFGMGNVTMEWDDCEEKLYQMVFDHRADESVTLEQIRETYKVFRADTEVYI